MSDFSTEILKLFESPSKKNSSPTISEKLRNLLDKDIILYGAGSGFFTFYTFILSRYNLNVKLLIDKKFDKPQKFCGFQAISPNDLNSLTADKRNSVVIVTVGKQEYHDEIVDFLKKSGFKNIIFASQIYEYHLPLVQPELMQKGFAYYIENKDRIIKAFELLEDDASREVYYYFLKFHMTQEVSLFSKYHPLKWQYFPRDIRLNRGLSRVINCGAYDGDTIRNLNMNFGKVEALVCFEPDPVNFRKLVEFVNSKAETIADLVLLLPLGAYECDCQLRFQSTSSSNSMISVNGNTVIQCVAIDHILPNFRPTLITMDIEGAELEALKGASRTITCSKPDLAVCVYHIPNHIWDIPLYLHSLVPKYRFYLRNYTGYPSETVLYATCEDL